MKKNILERKPEPPKNRKEFWEIFVKSCNNTYENQKELEDNQIEVKEKQCKLEINLEKGTKPFGKLLMAHTSRDVVPIA